jgi:hypothetical protein
MVLLAHVFRECLARFAKKVCHPSQRGFLHKRFLLDSVVNVDQACRASRLTHSQGGLLLFDVAAAFPSLNQEFLFRVLTAQGVPDCFIVAIKSFYRNNSTLVKMEGESTRSFDIFSGVRQGCPMSPILFALALDPFLRKLAGVVPKDNNPRICR